ncbi:hypothetical protein MLD38_034409 [Melastoma candidum]|uniref:Uncharacterized protein n=1 Tax=Melastoma candidum TaxID=119954 RepID=A0ACB9M9U6_9MYRT|nr:hypothetical protein MLD38_034409 [Melastoma candidum]
MAGKWSWSVHLKGLVPIATAKKRLAPQVTFDEVGAIVKGCCCPCRAQKDQRSSQPEEQLKDSGGDEDGRKVRKMESLISVDWKRRSRRDFRKEKMVKEMKEQRRMIDGFENLPCLQRKMKLLLLPSSCLQKTLFFY